MSESPRSVSVSGRQYELLTVSLLHVFASTVTENVVPAPPVTRTSKRSPKQLTETPGADDEAVVDTLYVVVPAFDGVDDVVPHALVPVGHSIVPVANW
jgi:hypothetical protein